MVCLYCKNTLMRSSTKYCSNQCQADQTYIMYIAQWQNGYADGSRGKNTKNLSQHIRRYLFDKYNKACSLCGWDKVNPITKVSPLEVDHIDGNHENNAESNLRLICPNCHSLTANFRNLNKGHGRDWRRERYIKVMPP